MHKKHQATKTFIKFQQLAIHVEWGNAALCRQAYNDLPNVSKTICPPQQATTLAGLWKLIQAINAQYWEQKENSPMKPELLDLLEISLNQSLTLTGLTTSLAKVLPIPSRRTTLRLYPGQGSTSEQKKVHHSRPFFEIQERQKANSTGMSVSSDNKLCLFCGTADTFPRTAQNPAWLLPSPSIQVWSGQVHIFQHRLEKRLSSPWDSAQPRIVLNSLCENSYSQCIHSNLDSLTLSLTSDTLLDMSWNPLWIPDLRLFHSFCVCSDLASPGIWHSTLLSSDSLMEPPILSSHSTRLVNLFSYWGIPELTCYVTLLDQSCMIVLGYHGSPAQSLDDWYWQYLFLATVTARIKKLTLCWDISIVSTTSETSRLCPRNSETPSACKPQNPQSNPH